MRDEVFTIVKAPIKITEQQIRDLLITAFEGSVGYWCRIDGYVYPYGITQTDIRQLGQLYEMLPTIDGGQIKLALGDPPKPSKFIPKNEWEFGPEDGEEDGDWLRLLLTKEKVIRGLEVMATKQLRHWADFLNETGDATTADVALQCMLFPDYVMEKGEVVYG